MVHWWCEITASDLVPVPGAGLFQYGVFCICASMHSRTNGRRMRFGGNGVRIVGGVYRKRNVAALALGGAQLLRFAVHAGLKRKRKKSGDTTSGGPPGLQYISAEVKWCGGG